MILSANDRLPRGNKLLNGIAVEVRKPKGIGWCRMAVLDGASAAPLHPFVTGNVQPDTRVITDAWQGDRRLDNFGYDHKRPSQRTARARSEDPGELLPAVHRVASLAKQWLLGTHQGAVDDAHLPGYLNEFTFRFNRRRSRSRAAVLPRDRTRRSPRPGRLPRPDSQPAPTTGAFCTAVGPAPGRRDWNGPGRAALENG
jgi:transposase-like protein